MSKRNNQRNYTESVTPQETVNEETKSEVNETGASDECLESLPALGVITDCARLNVRNEPNDTSEILGIVDALSEVQVDRDLSNAEWYKITTEAGLDGYCMSKYVALK